MLLAADAALALSGEEEIKSCREFSQLKVSIEPSSRDININQRLCCHCIVLGVPAAACCCCCCSSRLFCCCCFRSSLYGLRLLSLSRCTLTATLAPLSLHTSHLKCFLNENRNRNVEMIYFYLKGLTLRVLAKLKCARTSRRVPDTLSPLIIIIIHESVGKYECKKKHLVRALSTSKITTDEDKDLLQSKLHIENTIRTDARRPERTPWKWILLFCSIEKWLCKHLCVADDDRAKSDGKWLQTNRLSEYSVVRINNNEPFLVSWRPIN